MKILKKLTMILMLASLSLAVNASSEDFEKVELEITNAQASVLFDSFSIETQTIIPESFGASIYGTKSFRNSNNTICVKTELDIEDEPATFSCFALQRI